MTKQECIDNVRLGMTLYVRGINNGLKKGNLEGVVVAIEDRVYINPAITIRHPIKPTGSFRNDTLATYDCAWLYTEPIKGCPYCLRRF